MLLYSEESEAYFSLQWLIHLIFYVVNFSDKTFFSDFYVLNTYVLYHFSDNKCSTNYGIHGRFQI